MVEALAGLGQLADFLGELHCNRNGMSIHPGDSYGVTNLEGLFWVEASKPLVYSLASGRQVRRVAISLAADGN
jgi:hypothetical protein